MKLGFSRLLLSLFLILIIKSVHCQVVINEICPANVGTLINSNDEYDDWIEIYNAGSSAIDLTGYGLTDDLSKPFKFRFPSQILDAGQREVVFASDTIYDLIDHYELVVNAASTWRYVPGSATLDDFWREPAYNDASWLSGPGGIGFSDDDDNTVIDPTVSLMMRKTFYIPDTSNILSAVLLMDYDDGFVAYLNGIEIARANMEITSTYPAWNELASAAHEAQIFQGLKPDSIFIPGSILRGLIRPGNNVLSIEVHDRVAEPTDMSAIPYLFFGMKDSLVTFTMPPSWFRSPPKPFYNAPFKLSKQGESVYLVNVGGMLVDQVNYPAMESDHSYGRSPDGGSGFCYFETPTPDESNNAAGCYAGYVFPAVFSKTPGYYSGSISVDLFTTFPGAEIRYTTNGDAPSLSSTLYAGPITINATTSLRARCFSPGFLPSTVTTNTYFIDEDTRLPVFCLTTDSLNLWDENTGIYTYGPNAGPPPYFFGANFYQSWEKPVSFEFFDRTRNRIINFDAEFEIYGNYSRRKPQKSFEVKLKKKYGLGEVDYPFISDKPNRKDYTRMVIRNSGTDWNEVHFRDPLMQRLVKNTNVGYIATEPIVVYLNGSFWGVYHCTEKHSTRWVAANKGYKKDEIHFMDEIGFHFEVETGSASSFLTLHDYAISEDPTTTEFLTHVGSQLDLKNVADYFIAETYVNNGDWIGEWTNNIAIWRPKKEGGRWQYILIDTDFGFGLFGNVLDNTLLAAIDPADHCHSSNIFDALLHNDEFKRYFINRYADLINTIYLPSNVDAVMKQFRDSMAFDMVRHFEKWGHDTIRWNREITSMMQFVNQRPSIMREYIRSQFGLTNQVTLSVDVSPAGAGRVEISTVVPDSYPWSGVYFNGNPVTITAIPNPGYSFDHWESPGVITTNDHNKRTTYNFTINDQITAHFSGSAAPVELAITEVNYHSQSLFDAGDWAELHNYANYDLDISGWWFSDEDDYHKFIFPTGTVIPAGGYLVVTEDSAKFKTHFPSVTNRIGQTEFSLANDGELLRIFDYTGAIKFSMYYSDQLPWPEKADGGGYTCELSGVTSNPNDGNSWFDGCFGGSPGTAYSPQITMSMLIAGSSIICPGTEVLLRAGPLPDFNYQWKFNGQNIAGGNTPTYAATEAGTYSVAVNAQGCSAVSTPKELFSLMHSETPVVRDGKRCGKGNILLKASSKDSLYWYDSPTGHWLGSGSQFYTPPLTSSTSYYVVAGKLCPSPAVEVKAIVEEGSCESSFSVFPNPSSDNFLTLSSQEFNDGYANVIISNLAGQFVKNFLLMLSAEEKEHQLDITDLNPGVYVISFYQEDKFFVTKYIRTSE